MNGIIADIKKNKAVLLSNQGDFITIENKNYVLGQKVEIKKSQTSIFVKQLSTIAACFVLMVGLSISGFALFFQTVSYASIDINPSIQLELNRLNQVVRVKALNDDAKDLLSTVDLKFNDITSSLDKIIQTAQDMGYMTDDKNYVLVDIVSNKDKLKDKLSTTVEKYESCGIEVVVEKASEQELNMAHNMGISIGRVKAIEEYTDTFGGTIEENKDNVAEAPIGKIKKLIQTKKNDGLSDKNDISQQKGTDGYDNDQGGLNTQNDPKKKNLNNEREAGDQNNNDINYEKPNQSDENNNENRNGENKPANPSKPSSTIKPESPTKTDNPNTGNEGNNPGEGNPKNGSPGGSNSGEGNSKNGSPGGSNSGEGNPKNGNPGGGNSGGGNSKSGNPGGSNSGEGNSKSGNPGGSNPGGGNSGGSNSGGNHSGGGNSGKGSK